MRTFFFEEFASQDCLKREPWMIGTGEIVKYWRMNCWLVVVVLYFMIAIETKVISFRLKQSGYILELAIEISLLVKAY